MVDLGRLASGAGRVARGQEQARADQQIAEARAQKLQQNQMQLEEMRRADEARRRMAELPSTIRDINFGTTGATNMPTYQVPQQQEPKGVTVEVTPTPQVPVEMQGGRGSTAGDTAEARRLAQDIARWKALSLRRQGFLSPDEQAESYNLMRRFGGRWTQQKENEAFGNVGDVPADMTSAGTIGTQPAQPAPAQPAPAAPAPQNQQLINQAIAAFQTNPQMINSTTLNPNDPQNIANLQAQLAGMSPAQIQNFIDSMVRQGGSIQGATQAGAAPAEPDEDIPPPAVAGLDTGTRSDPIQTVAKGRPKMFEANPQAYNPYLEQGMRNREYLIGVANAYRQSGMPQQAFEIEAKIQGLDVDLYKMATDQAISEFRIGGDPTRMVGMLRQFTNVPVDIQFRSDGLYNMYVNGEMLEQPLSAIDLTDELRTFVDEAYRQQKVTASLERQSEVIKSQLEADKEVMKQRAQMVREAVIARINGQYNLAAEEMKNRGYSVTNLNDGRVVITAKDGSLVGMVDLNQNVLVIDGQEIPDAPQVQQFQFQ